MSQRFPFSAPQGCQLFQWKYRQAHGMDIINADFPHRAELMGIVASVTVRNGKA